MDYSKFTTIISVNFKKMIDKYTIIGIFDYYKFKLVENVNFKYENDILYIGYNNHIYDDLISQSKLYDGYNYYDCSITIIKQIEGYINNLALYNNVFKFSTQYKNSIIVGMRDNFKGNYTIIEENNFVYVGVDDEQQFRGIFVQQNYKKLDDVDLRRIIDQHFTQTKRFDKNSNQPTNFSYYMISAHGEINDEELIELPSGIRLIMLCTRTGCPAGAEYEALLYKYGLMENIKPDLSNVGFLSQGRKVGDYNMCIVSGNIDYKFDNALITLGCSTKDSKIKNMNLVPNIKFTNEAHAFRTGLFKVPIKPKINQVTTNDFINGVDQIVSKKDNNNKNNPGEYLTNFSNPPNLVEFDSVVVNVDEFPDLKSLISYVKKNETANKYLITILLSTCTGTPKTSKVDPIRCMVDITTYNSAIVSYVDNEILYNGLTMADYDIKMGNKQNQSGGNTNYKYKYFKYKNKYRAIK